VKEHPVEHVIKKRNPRLRVDAVSAGGGIGFFREANGYRNVRFLRLSFNRDSLHDISFRCLCYTAER
jgi:hypothetical protein